MLFAIVDQRKRGKREGIYIKGINAHVVLDKSDTDK